MSFIEVGNFSGDAERVQAEVNGDGTKSPRYGLNDTALAALAAIVTALAGKSTAANQATAITALADILAALQDLAPADGHEAVTPSDSTTLTGVRTLFIGTGGDVIATVGGTDETYRVLDGTYLAIKATKVKLGTTATDIVALK